jgi:nucleotide-binding universal stress UspA family protein
MDPKRILVPLRLVTRPDAAIERAVSLARLWGAELYLLHAVPLDQRFSFRQNERLERWAELRARAEAAGVRVQTVEQRGDPAEIIVLHADARAVDLIVMASERRTGWARLRQPSVAERVLRRTQRPTLVVHGDDAVRHALFENVLVAVDLSPGSGAVLDSAMRLAGSVLRQLTVVHAVDSIGPAQAVRSPAMWMVPEYRGYVLNAARRQLEAVMPPSLGTGVHPQLRVATGPAGEAISTQAADLNADLVVVGRSRRFMHLGSTAVRILRHTDRAVLVVPPAARPAVVPAHADQRAA